MVCGWGCEAPKWWACRQCAVVGTLTSSDSRTAQQLEGLLWALALVDRADWPPAAAPLCPSGHFPAQPAFPNDALVPITLYISFCNCVELKMLLLFGRGTT